MCYSFSGKCYGGPDANTGVMFAQIYRHGRIGPLVRHGKCHSLLIGRNRVDDGIIQTYKLIQ
jgi:hypothetical protein